MKDTVPRITFFVGRAWEAGGLVQGVPFCFFGFCFFSSAKNSVIFLCTRFCLNHVQMVLQGKKKENACICVTARTLLCDSISAASVKGLIFV